MRMLLLCLLIPFVAAAQAPDTCRVYTTVYRLNGQPAIGLEFTFAYVADSINLVADEAIAKSTDSSGHMDIGLIRGAWVLVTANIDSLRDGQLIRVPDADSSELRMLYTAAHPPSAYLVLSPALRLVSGTDSGLVDHLVVSGSGATVTITGPSAAITVTGETGDTTDVLHDRMAAIETDIAASADSIARLLDSIAVLRAAIDAVSGADTTGNWLLYCGADRVWAQHMTRDSLAARALQLSDSLAAAVLRVQTWATARIKDSAAARALQLSDSLASRMLATQQWVINQSFLTSYTETDPIAGAAAATALDTAKAGTAHSRRTDNPHSVTAGQVGALTAETDPSAVHTIASDGADPDGADLLSPKTTAQDVVVRRVAEGAGIEIDSTAEERIVISVRLDSTLLTPVLDPIYSRSGGGGGVTDAAVRDSIQALANGTSGYSINVPAGEVARFDSVRLGSAMMDSIPANEWMYSDTGRWCYIGGEMPHVPYPWTYGPLYKQGVVRIRFQTKCTYTSPSSFKLVLDTANGVCGGEVNWYIRSFRMLGTSLGSHRLIGNWGIGPSGAHSETSGYGGETSFARTLSYPSSACIGVVEAFMVANNGVWVDGWIEVAFQIPPANTSTWYVKIIDL